MTGSTSDIIAAVVAVFDMNIDNTAVMVINPASIARLGPERAQQDPREVAVEGELRRADREEEPTEEQHEHRMRESCVERGERGRVEAVDVDDGLIADEQDLGTDDEDGGRMQRDGLADPQDHRRTEDREHAMAGLGQAVEIEQERNDERVRAAARPAERR